MAHGTIQELDDLQDGDLSARPGEAVAAPHAPLRAKYSGPAQGSEQLLQELHRDLAPAGELGDRHWHRVTVEVKLTGLPCVGEDDQANDAVGWG